MHPTARIAAWAAAGTLLGLAVGEPLYLALLGAAVGLVLAIVRPRP